MRQFYAGLVVSALFGWSQAFAGTCGTAGVHYDSYGNPCVYNYGTSGGSSGSSAPYSGTPSACSASTVGTTATLVLDSVANGAGRAGGGFILPAAATAPVEYQWANSSAGLTTTPGGTVLQVLAGGQIPFAGAPNTQLYATSTATQAGSCFVSK